MDTVKVKLLNYDFRFRDLRWRQEFDIKYDEKKDRLRTVLAHALDEVSGIKVGSPAEAERVLDAIPSAVLYRIFVVYKGSLPEPRTFKTLGLYRAPEPSKLIQRIQEAEVERDHIMDRVEREMEAKFGRRELQEAREIERLMLKNSKGRGLTPASPDDETDQSAAPTTPPPAPENKVAAKTFAEAAEAKPAAKPRPKPERKYV
jgi:hypothetical protein